MMGELYYIRHPNRIRLLWAFVYTLIVASFVYGAYAVTNHIVTHSVPVGQIQLIVPYSKYLVGEPVTFTLKNNYNSPVYFTNNCPGEPLAVYMQVNGKWVRQHDTASAKDCPSEQRQVSVPANGVVNGTFQAWHNLFSKPGKYMIVAYVDYFNSLPYQEFEVITPPPIKPKPVATPAPAVIKKTVPAPVVTKTNIENNEVVTPRTNPVTLPTYTQKQSQTITIKSSSGRTTYGTINVQFDANTIYVISIAPSGSCTYEGGSSGTQVEVTFVCGNRQAQSTLTISGGTVVANTQYGA